MHPTAQYLRHYLHNTCANTRVVRAPPPAQYLHEYLHRTCNSFLVSAPTQVLETVFEYPLPRRKQGEGCFHNAPIARGKRGGVASQGRLTRGKHEGGCFPSAPSAREGSGGFFPRHAGAKGADCLPGAASSREARRRLLPERL